MAHTPPPSPLLLPHRPPLPSQPSSIPSTLPSTDDAADATFWRRMNSPSSADDLPEMSFSLPVPPALSLELLIATPAGKPLLHFRHAPTSRPSPSLSTLCAATAAFQHATAARPHLVCTPAGLVLTLVAGTLHVAVSSADESVPPLFLRALARIAVAALHARLSAAFAPFLATRPGADVAHQLAPARALAHAALRDAVAYPLPYALQSPPALPCPTRPSSRAAVADALRCGLLCDRHILTHAVVFTASPPFPRRVIATASPADAALSPLDLLLLMSAVPMRPDALVELPERVYLHADEFKIAYTLAVRSVQLRLDPDDYDNFKGAVGGAGWRPEWNCAGGDVVWILVVMKKGLERYSAAGKGFLDFVEKALDRASATRDLMVSMERPWTLNDMSLVIEPSLQETVRAVVLLEKRRIIGTVGSFGHNIGLAVLQALVQWDRQDMSVRSPLLRRTKQSLVARFPKSDMYIVLWERKFVVCFADSVDVDHALAVTKGAFVPWLRRFRWSLVPEHDHTTLPPPTPLAGMLSPFLS